MTGDTPCPDDDALRRLVLGLAGDAPDGLEAHFAGCPACAVRAAGLDDPADDLIGAVRGAGLPLTASPVPAAVLDRLLKLSPPPRPPADDLAGRSVGPYRVERLIGRGGMGVVYLARHDRIDRPVALKLLPAGVVPEREWRFRQAERLFGTVTHPNVVRLYEFGEADGRPFLAMEFVAGGTLADRLAAAPLAPAAAARLVAGAARGVAAGHRQHILHRDLKPANILIDPPDTAKVADFGLAKVPAGGATGGFETASGAVLGTPGYMAPEQAAGRPADLAPAADVYGLGAALYECLTGRPPFTAATVLETLDQVRHREPVPVRRLQPGVPRDLETICLKCLEKAPARRYGSADELADDLDRFTRGEPVRARPVGALTRAAKWARRRPTAAALVGVSAASAVALAAVVGSYTVRLREEVDRANANERAAEQRRAEAAANYRASRDAIERMLSRLDARRAAAVPRLGELTRDQLEDALAFYRGVMAGQPDPDPAVRLDAGRAWAVAGSLQFYLGHPDAAREYLARAVDLLEGLPPEYRERDDCRTRLIHALNHLANLTAKPGEDEAAEGYFRRALAEHEARVQAAPDDPAARNDLSRGEHNLATLYFARGAHGLAERHYDRSAAIVAGLAARHPHDRTYPVELAGTLVNLGLLYSQSGRPDRAADAFRRAEGLVGPLAAAAPADDDLGQLLAGVYVNWGNLLQGRGDGPGALAKLDRAVALADASLGREPAHRAYRSRALEAHGSRAQTLAAAGRFAAAVPDWDRVVELADDGPRPAFRAERAVVLARAGRHGRAAAEALELSAAATGDVLYNLACVLARAIGPAETDPVLGPLLGHAAADAYAAAAVRLLRRLTADGYFRDPAHVVQLAVDADLNRLRRRTDFRALLDDLTGKPPR